MNKRDEAIWFGRFQPPSIAHFASLNKILEEWKLVHVGIVKYTPQPRDIDPIMASHLSDESSFLPERNPFSPEEVRDMWLACIMEASLADRVHLHIVPRPEYWPEYRSLFPPERVNHVQVSGGSGESSAEVFRAEFYPKYYGRRIWRVAPPFMLHNSEIRRRIAEQKGGWSEYLPAGTYETFMRINGPERVA